MAKQYSKAEQKFWEYKPYIIGEFLAEFGESYHNVKTIRDAWFHLYDYSLERENFLIMKSQDFLYTHTESREFKYLESLSKKMADYLSEYTVRKFNLTERDAVKQARKQQKVELFNAIYTNSKYIRKLKYNHAKENVFYVSDQDDSPKRTPDTVANRRKRIRREQAKRAYDVSKQVRGEFAEVSKYKKR